jgi:hypothetical protein
MTRRAPATIHLTDQVLAHLHEWRPVPRTTRQVAESVGHPGPTGERRVWRALDWLTRNGHADRIRMPEYACALWHTTNEPAHPELDAHDPERTDHQ